MSGYTCHASLCSQRRSADRESKRQPEKWKLRMISAADSRSWQVSWNAPAVTSLFMPGYWWTAVAVEPPPNSKTSRGGHLLRELHRVWEATDSPKRPYDALPAEVKRMCRQRRSMGLAVRCASLLSPVFWHFHAKYRSDSGLVRTQAGIERAVGADPGVMLRTHEEAGV